MKNLFSGAILFLWVLVACDGGDSNAATNNGLISTEENPVQNLGALEKELQGTWKLRSTDCLGVTGEEMWNFSNGILEWNAYTHPYELSHDTLQVAGQLLVIAINHGEMELFDVNAGCKKILRRP